MANSVDPDETPRSAAFYLGLHCLFRSVSLNTYGKYSIFVRTVDWNMLGCCALLYKKLKKKHNEYKGKNEIFRDC